MSTKIFKRKSISLDTKIQILDRLKTGEGSTAVAKYFNLNECTVRSIKKNEEKIRASVTAGSSTSLMHTSYVRDTSLELMEKALMIWIEDNIHNKIPLDGSIIKLKAVKIFNQIKETQPATNHRKSTFSASKGWFANFKKRHFLNNLKIKGETASVDEKSAQNFPHELAKIVLDNYYTPDQVFNAGETVLFWKKMPKKANLARNEKVLSGFKVSKDRITLILCSNASGDYIMKPMIINRSLNPRAMKGLNKKNLPVYWNANEKAWVTNKIFKDWFYQCFVPDAEEYMKHKNLAFKILLLIDNAPGHPTDLQHENVKVVFLPPNTTPLIQPLEQGIIYAFKVHYIKRVFQKIFDQIHSDNSLSANEIWEKFTILDCIKIIAATIRGINPLILNTSWKNIWPEVVLDQNIPSLDDDYYQITNLAHQLGGEGFDNLTPDDIIELATKKEFNEEELVDTVTDSISSESENDDTDHISLTFNINTVRKGLDMATEVENYFLDIDPNMERSFKFGRKLRRCMAQYEEVYKELDKHTKPIEPIVTIVEEEFEETTHKEEISSDTEDHNQIKKKIKLLQSKEENIE